MVRISGNGPDWNQALKPFAGICKNKSLSSSRLQSMLRYHVGRTVFVKHSSESNIPPNTQPFIDVLCLLDHLVFKAHFST